jgi:hypothetical protein
MTGPVFYEVNKKKLRRGAAACVESGKPLILACCFATAQKLHPNQGCHINPD